MQKGVGRAEEYLEIAEAKGIARRYFVMNTFEGALAVFGVLFGAYVSRIADLALVASLVLAAAIALAVSGMWSAFLTEEAEKKRKLKSLESAMHRKLEGTKIAKAFRATAYIGAAVNGISPFIASLIILSPLLLVPGIAPDHAYHSAFALSAAVILALGAYQGKISGDNAIVSALKLLAAAGICAIVIILVPS